MPEYYCAQCEQEAQGDGGVYLADEVDYDDDDTALCPVHATVLVLLDDEAPIENPA
jgi:hypothetical protein